MERIVLGLHRYYVTRSKGPITSGFTGRLISYPKSKSRTWRFMRASSREGCHEPRAHPEKPQAPPALSDLRSARDVPRRSGQGEHAVSGIPQSAPGQGSGLQVGEVRRGPDIDAKFPFVKILENFDFGFQSSIDRKRIKDLACYVTPKTSSSWACLEWARLTWLWPSA